MISYLKENAQNALHRLAKHLQQNKLTVSCAESCTGGGLAYAFTALPGSSAWFKHSVVTYSNAAKTAHLHVPEDTLHAYGAVSPQTAAAMAQGVITHFQSDVAISVTGIAGPDGATVDKPVGTVWFGFVVDGQTVTQMRQFTGDREAVRQQAIEFALVFVCKILTI